MPIYWSIFLWVFFLGLTQPIEHNPLLNNRATECKASWKLAFALMFPVTFFAAVRGPICDTPTYVGIFEAMPERIDVFSEWIGTWKDSQLFYGLTDLWKIYVSDDPQWWLVLIAVIHGVLLLLAFRQYSVNMPMSVYLFIASTMFTWMYNGIRQFIVVVVLFVLTDCIVKNRWYIYIPVALVLAGMEPVLSVFHIETPWWLGGIHQSALLMIPIFFFVQGKALNGKMLLMTAVFCLLAVSGALEPLLGSAIEVTDRGDAFKYLLEGGDDGAHPLRAVFSAIPLVLALVKQKEINAMGDVVPPIVPISINMSLFAVALYAASTLTGSGVMVGRLPAYTELYSYLLIPWLITNVYKKDRTLMTFCVYGVFFLWFVYQMCIGWNNMGYISEILGIRYWYW